MVVCNVERFLGEAIESILCQTFRDFELVVVDYGSTDSTKDTVAQIAAKDRRVRVHEIPHCGLGQARNAACSLARGRYIALMDADDVAMPWRLQLQMDFLKMHPDIGLLGASVQWIDSTGRDLFVCRFPTNDKQLREQLSRRCCFWQPTVILSKEAFVRSGGYRDAFSPAEDYDLWLRITEQYQCSNLPEVVLKYRIHPNQVSLRKRKQQTLGIVAAQRSAYLRQKGDQDTFDSIDKITPEVLRTLGVTEAAEEQAFMEDSRRWIRLLSSAGETSAALACAVELSGVPWAHVQEWQIADLHLTVARFRWMRREFDQGIRSAIRAVRIRPKVLGRPLRPWLQRLGLVPHTD
jgi:glycosyltransferase involved in cell wall biosynthesis